MAHLIYLASAQTLVYCYEVAESVSLDFFLYYITYSFGIPEENTTNKMMQFFGKVFIVCPGHLQSPEKRRISYSFWTKDLVFVPVFISVS